MVSWGWIYCERHHLNDLFTRWRLPGRLFGYFGWHDGVSMD